MQNNSSVYIPTPKPNGVVFTAAADGPYDVKIVQNDDEVRFNSFVSISLAQDEQGMVAVPLSAATGTITVEASEDGVNYGVVPNGNITLGDSAYDRPEVLNPIRYFRVTLAGVSGASHFRVEIRSSNEVA